MERLYYVTTFIDARLKFTTIDKQAAAASISCPHRYLFTQIAPSLSRDKVLVYISGWEGVFIASHALKYCLIH